MIKPLYKIFLTSAVALLALASAAKAQVVTVLDPLNNTLTSDYTTFHTLDNGSTGADSVAFVETSGSLTVNFVGSTNVAEQALYLAPATDFSKTFAVGDTLFLDTNVAAGQPTEDIGLAISAANPVAENAGNGYNSRLLFDYADVSLRSSGNAAIVSTSINGTLTSPSDVGIGSTGFVNAVYIDWLSNTGGVGGNQDVFSFGYIEGTTQFPLTTGTYEAGSTIGTDIGVYGDVRNAGEVLGSVSNLSLITPVPEPATWAAMVFGAAILLVAQRRRARSV